MYEAIRQTEKNIRVIKDHPIEYIWLPEFREGKSERVEWYNI